MSLFRDLNSKNRELVKELLSTYDVHPHATTIENRFLGQGQNTIENEAVNEKARFQEKFYTNSNHIQTRKGDTMVG